MGKLTKPNNPRQEKDDLYCDKLEKTIGIQNIIKKHSKIFFNTFDYIFLTVIFFILLLHLISSIDAISWQLSAIGRTLLIKILPHYNWKHLKNEQCLVPNYFNTRETVIGALNCNLCEDITEVEVHSHLDEDILEERYINLDIPVILLISNENWPNDSKFIEDLKAEPDFASSYPCGLGTNVVKEVTDVGTILSKSKYFAKFFIHFQNCEIEAMRTLRRYVYRPTFLPSIYSPTLYNWLLWSKNYNSTNYKRVDLVEKVTIIGQLFGSTYYRLIARKNCEYSCPVLSFDLRKGEVLVFTSLWDLEYKPYENGENMAVIMEY